MTVSGGGSIGTDGAGFVIYHKNKRIHAESIHMPDTSTVFQAEIETISHACQYTLANLKELNIII